MLEAKIMKDKNEKNVQADKVAMHFTHSASTYSQGAQLQQIVANQLLAKLPLEVQSIALDLGCGPGLFTSELKKRVQHLVSLDLSSQMLAEVPEGPAKVRANSHALPFRADCFDFVFSSLMVQWCDFEQVLNEVNAILKPGGKAYISTLIQGSLAELEQAWAEIDDDQHVHKYLTMEQLIGQVNKGNWQSIEIEHETQTLWFDKVRALAKELKLLGANYVQGRKHKGLMTKSKWQAMEQAYKDKYYCEQQQAIPASYQVVLFELRK